MVEQGELLPCPNPWCEAKERVGDFSPAVRLHHLGNYRVVCTSCMTEGPLLRTKADAITAWNTRHLNDFERGLEAGAVEQAGETLLTEFAVVTGQPERSLAELPEEERGQWVACVGKCISAYLAALIPPVKP